MPTRQWEFVLAPLSNAADHNTWTLGVWTHVEEDCWEVSEDRLHELETEGPGHLCHAGQPVGLVRIHQLTQVLQAVAVSE